jgi:hypothetical protein
MIVHPADTQWDFKAECPKCGNTHLISWSTKNAPPDFEKPEKGLFDEDPAQVGS